MSGIKNIIDRLKKGTKEMQQAAEELENEYREKRRAKVEECGIGVDFGLGPYRYEYLVLRDHLVIKYCPEYDFLLVSTDDLSLHTPIKYLRGAKRHERWVELPFSTAYGWEGSGPIKEHVLYINKNIYLPESIARAYGDKWKGLSEDEQPTVDKRIQKKTISKSLRDQINESLEKRLFVSIPIKNDMLKGIGGTEI